LLAVLFEGLEYVEKGELRRQISGMPQNQSPAFVGDEGLLTEVSLLSSTRMSSELRTTVGSHRYHNAAGLSSASVQFNHPTEG
jgi:hypothetical protein